MADQPPSIEDLQRIGHLTKKIRLRGYITTRTGLHIGGTNARLSIGGTDATVVRNPFTNQPYIPGSSLKGKMRSLIERLEGKFSKIGGLADAGPYMDDPSHPICKVFGLLPERLPKSKPQPISQLIVRDAHLSKKSRQRLNENAGLDMPFTEVKTEVVLDRITAQAVPRQLERVPQGVSFLLDLILNVYELDDEAQLLSYVFRGLDLVQNDYLGGKGTRGSGQVKIRIARVGYKTQETYESNKTWQDYTSVAIPSELELRTRKG